MIGERIKRLREETRVTQKAIAEAVKTSTKTVMSWESGKTEPKASELVLIANRLGVTITELMGQKENMQNKIMAKINTAINQFNDDELNSLNALLEGMFIRHQVNNSKVTLRD